MADPAARMLAVRGLKLTSKDSSTRAVPDWIDS
jgi:hypothetical protein